MFAAINASIIERAAELLPANLPCWCWPLCL
ncbi:hypothetical protein [Klebsiella pneumoniae]|nr:hypothetical protein [Klebsiella pneumoniae]